MKKNISISFDEKLIKKLDDVCRVSERTKSWLVNKAVKNYLDEIEDTKIAFQRSRDSDSEFITEKELRNALKLFWNLHFLLLFIKGGDHWKIQGKKWRPIIRERRQ